MLFILYPSIPKNVTLKVFMIHSFTKVTMKSERMRGEVNAYHSSVTQAQYAKNESEEES